MKNFAERFVALVEEKQITLNCGDAKILLKDARKGMTYTVDTVPDGKMIRVLVGDNEEEENQYLNCGDIGFFTWKIGEDREDGFFLNFNYEEHEWQYTAYEGLEECEFELITDEIVELDC